MIDCDCDRRRVEGAVVFDISVERLGGPKRAAQEGEGGEKQVSTR